MRSNIRSQFIRCLCPVLAVILTVTAMSGLFTFPAAADGSEPGKTNFIKWKRVYTCEDLQTGYNGSYVLLFWGGWYYRDYVSLGNKMQDGQFVGESTEKHPELARAGFDDEFYTKADDNLQAWYFWDANTMNYVYRNIRLAAYDSPEAYANRTTDKIICPVGGTKLGYTNYQKVRYSADGSMRIITSDWNTSAAQTVGYGFVKVVDNRYSYETCTGICHNGANLYMQTETNPNVATDFIMHIGEPVEFCEYSDFTVESGETYQIAGNSYLPKEGTITVAPGAVLTIGGYFVNDGHIKNYGTVIVRENAYVCSYVESGSYGEMTTYGYLDKYWYTDSSGQRKSVPGEGNMIVMKNAFFTTNSEYAWVRFFDGTKLILAGTMMITDYIEFYKADLDVLETGQLLVGFKPIARRVMNDINKDLGFSTRERYQYEADDKNLPLENRIMGEIYMPIWITPADVGGMGLDFAGDESCFKNDGTVVINVMVPTYQSRGETWTDYDFGYEKAGQVYHNRHGAPVSGNKVYYCISYAGPYVFD